VIPLTTDGIVLMFDVVFCFWGLSKMIPQPGVFDVIIVGTAKTPDSLQPQ
jgi:hypothetical protein